MTTRANEIRERWESASPLYSVICPECAFTFDAYHKDDDGGYSCPVCAEQALLARVEELEKERDTLRKFFSVIARDVWDLEPLDGGDFQDYAEKLGLIVLVPADEIFTEAYGADEMYVWSWHPLARTALEEK